MKNIYSPGFYALLAALLIISGSIFWATWTNGKSGSTQEAFAFINSLSALLQALAAAIVAWLAHKGLSSWKQELIHSKAHGVVWDANVAFRKIEASIERLCLEWKISTPPTKPNIIIDALRQDPIDQQFEDFLSHCQVLDKVVLKKDWVWADRAQNLRSALEGFAIEIHKPKRSASQGLGGLLTGKTEESTKQAGEKLRAAFKPIEEGLYELDKKYSE
ncbi:hypothetical protein E4195_06140 [Pseudomonas putida]|uniref:hypothetical protein n=1 Tax=Pseudomonas putida TaxID=303 RepID=UPI001074A176|nr:hypothetical protein [Pseudomonas putida]TFW38553.1 hypothetical protein E4195_06140 [Pseudomonas putida]